MSEYGAFPGARCLVITPSDGTCPALEKLKSSIGATGAALQCSNLSDALGWVSAPEQRGTLNVLILVSPPTSFPSSLPSLSLLTAPTAVLSIIQSTQERSVALSQETGTMLQVCGAVQVEIIKDSEDWSGIIEGTVVTTRAKLGSVGGSVPLGNAVKRVKVSSGAGSVVPAGGELVDEDALLEEDEAAFKPDTSAAGCAPGATKRACANCTCGLAEEQASGARKLTLDMLENPAVDSSCGSCALGDAVRCAGCPYRGLPPFTPGEKIVLPDNFILDDGALME